MIVQFVDKQIEVLNFGIPGDEEVATPSRVIFFDG
jgi:hypothetical protein